MGGVVGLVSLLGLPRRLRTALAGAAPGDDFITVVVTTPKTMVPITMVDIILRVAVSRLEGRSSSPVSSAQ